MSFMSKIRGVFRSPSPAKSSTSQPAQSAAQQQRRKSKSQGDLRFATSTSQVYAIKEKDLQHKLHSASWRGELNRVIELCRPDKINVPDKEGRTPLLLAIANNHSEVVQHLLNEGAKMQCFDKENRSPFIIATLAGNAKMVELLLIHLDSKNLVNIPDKNGLNPLIYAVKSENMAIVELLVKEKYVNLDYQDKDKNTSMHYSVIQHKYELIDMLVDNGADIDVQNADGQTPLMVAAKAGDEKLTDYLLDYGADKKQRDKAGRTALQLAESSGNRRCIELIREPRPVKPNRSKEMRTNNNTLSRQDNNSGAIDLTSSNDPAKPSDGGRFEKLFEGAAASNGVGDHDDSDTSHIIHSGSKKQQDTWADSDSDEDDSDDLNEFKNKLQRMDTQSGQQKPSSAAQATTAATIISAATEPHYDSLFMANSAHDEVIDLFPEDEDNWVFGNNPTATAGGGSASHSPSKQRQTGGATATSNPVVLSSFQPDLARKKSLGDTGDTSANWTIMIFTSNLIGAGTDANVYMQIFGSKAASARFYLDKKIVVPGGNVDLFEQGQCDKFSKHLADIGRPIKIKIGHENNGAFSGWHLEKIILVNSSSNEKYVYTCGRWLAQDELDQRIEIEIPTDNDNNTKPTAIKQRPESSTSSWNSSDDDSTGLSNASPSKTQPTTTPLKKIEEMNETINSKKSDTTPKPPAAKTPTNGPPGISDISDSDSSSSSSDRDVFGPAKKQSGIKKQSSSDSNWLTPKQQQQQLVDLSDVEESATNSHSIGNLTRQFEAAVKPQAQQQSHSLQSSPAKGQLHGLTDLMRAERISRQSSVDSQQQQQKPPAHLVDLMKEERDRSNSAIYSVVSRDSPAHLIDLMKAERSNSVTGGGGGGGSVQGLQSLMRAEMISASSKQNSTDSLSKQPAANSHLAELMREEKSQQQAANHHSSSQQSLSDLMRFEKASRQASIDSGASSGGQKPAHLADLMREERSNSVTKQQQQQSPSGPLSKQNSMDSLSSKQPQQHLVDLMREEKMSAVSRQQKSPPPRTPPPPQAVKGLKELIREERDAVMKSTSSVSSSTTSFPSPPKPVPSQQTPTLGLKQLMREERTHVIHRTQQQQQQTSHVGVANNGANLFSTPPEGFRNNDDQFRREAAAAAANANPYENVDPWGMSTNVQNNNHSHLANSSNDKLQLPMTKVVSFDDSDDENVEIFGSSTQQQQQRSSQYTRIDGSINQGVGAFIGSSHSLNQSPVKHYQQQQQQQHQITTAKTSTASSFGSILPEMFSGGVAAAAAATSTTTTPVRHSRDEDVTRKLLNSLEERNARLEESRGELEQQLKRAEEERLRSQLALRNFEKLLAERDQRITEINKEKMRTELDARKESNDVMILQKQISELKDDKLTLENKLAVLQTTAALVAAAGGSGAGAGSSGGHNSLRASDELTAPLVAQNQTLSIQVRELENQIQELNSQRKELVLSKEKLIGQLHETESEVEKQSQALQIAVLQFNVEKKTLKDDIEKSKRELAVLNDLKKSLLSDIESLKSQLEQKNLDYERMSVEKASVERQLSKERDESEHGKRHLEFELSSTREKLLKLTESLANAEAKLAAVENETRTTRSNIDNRERQVDELRDQLARKNDELTRSVRAHESEKSEKERLIKRIEEMEKRIERNLKETESSPYIEQIRNENQQLKNQLEDLRGKLQRTEHDLKSAQRRSEQLSQHQSSPRSSNKTTQNGGDHDEARVISNLVRGTPPLPQNGTVGNEPNNGGNELIKAEIIQLRRNFESMMEKFSNLENSNYELKTTLQHSMHRSTAEPGSDFLTTRQNPIDIASLITDSANVRQHSPIIDQYLVKSLYQKDDMTANELAEIKSGINNLSQQIINNKINTATNNSTTNNSSNNVPFANGYLSQLDSHSSPMHQARFCPKCSTQSSAYLDMLKYELARRIEFQVAREMTGSSNSPDMKFSTGRHHYMSALNTSTSNYDSLYNTMSSISRNSNIQNDLLATLRSRYLI